MLQKMSYLIFLISLSLISCDQPNKVMLDKENMPIPNIETCLEFCGMLNDQNPYEQYQVLNCRIQCREKYR